MGRELVELVEWFYIGKNGGRGIWWFIFLALVLGGAITHDRTISVLAGLLMLWLMLCVTVLAIADPANDKGWE